MEQSHAKRPQRADPLHLIQGLDKFSKGYETMGFQVANDGTITYREWAPAADAAFLIGDFSKQKPVASWDVD